MSDKGNGHTRTGAPGRPSLPAREEALCQVIAQIIARKMREAAPAKPAGAEEAANTT